MIRLLENHHFSYVNYKFEPTKPDELRLIPNEVIVSSTETSGGWTYGFSMGATGWYPENYVEKIEPKFDLKKNLKRDLLCANQEHYKAEIHELIENEKEYIKDFKQKFGIINSDFGARVLSSKIESTLILRVCETFIKKYEAFIVLLEKESKKAVSRQTFGQLYSDFFSTILNVVLHYCQLHPYLIQSILANKNEIEKAHQNKEIQSSQLAITKFYSSPFLRMSAVSDLLKDAADYVDKSCNEHLHFKTASTSFSFLNYGSDDVRKSYMFMAQIIPQLKEHLNESMRDLQKNLLFHANVHAVNISIQDDPRPYSLVFHSKMTFYGYQTSRSDPSTFVIKDVFKNESIIMEDIENRSDMYNLIKIKNRNSGPEITFMTEGSPDKKFILSLFDSLQRGSSYEPFWVDTKNRFYTLPGVSVKQRATLFKGPPSDTCEALVDYTGTGMGTTASRISSSVNAVLESHGGAPNSPTNSSDELLRRMTNMEIQLSEIRTKLDAHIKQGNRIEELLNNLSRTIKR